MKTDKTRMLQWLLISTALYALAVALAATESLPQIQIIMWKLGHITVAAFVGYWIDRNAFKAAGQRMNSAANPLQEIRRAIIIGASMLATALAL